MVTCVRFHLPHSPGLQNNCIQLQELCILSLTIQTFAWNMCRAYSRTACKPLIQLYCVITVAR